MPLDLLYLQIVALTRISYALRNSLSQYITVWF